jgi:hypothetical protein
MAFHTAKLGAGCIRESIVPARAFIDEAVEVAFILHSCKVMGVDMRKDGWMDGNQSMREIAQLRDIHVSKS